MKKFLLYIIIFIFCVSCSKSVTDSYYGKASLHTDKILTEYIKATIKSYNRSEFNKICYKEQIPSQLDRWYSTTFKDYETSEKITNYLYIKNDSGYISPETYKLYLDIKEIADTTFILEIRKIEKVK